MIRLDRVTLAHRGMPVLRDVSLGLDPGEVVLLTGETGAGKTSLIRALYGDLRPSSGSVIVDGVDIYGVPARKIPALRRRIGIIFQDDRLLEDRNVYDNIRFALEIRMRRAEEINRVALQSLADLGLSHLRSKMPSQLSGGEAQRVGLARALAGGPTIVLADEPTGDLDADTSRAIFSALSSRRSPSTLFFISTHDVDRAGEAFPDARRLHLEGGRLVELTPA